MSWNIVYIAQARQDLRDIYYSIRAACAGNGNRANSADYEDDSFPWRNAHASATLWRRTVA